MNIRCGRKSGYLSLAIVSGTELSYHDRYIKEVKKATLVKEISPEQAIWSMYYEFSTLGVSSRVFTALQIARLETQDGRRTGYEGYSFFHCTKLSNMTYIRYFIQIPVDLSEDPELAKKEEKGVKGRYVSVERLKELENGKIEWRMATSSSPGGSLPSFLVESSMAGQISAVSTSSTLTTLSKAYFWVGCPTLLEMACVDAVEGFACAAAAC